MEGDPESLFPLAPLPSVQTDISCPPPRLELLQGVGDKSGWGCRRAVCQPALCCLQPLQHPGAIPQHPNGEELGRKQQKTRKVFFFAHVLFVAAVGSCCVCRQRESKLFLLGVSECCWDTESRKLLQEKNQRWIKVLSLGWVILDVTSTCRGSEQAWELSKLPHCWETSFNLRFIFHLRV